MLLRSFITSSARIRPAALPRRYPPNLGLNFFVLSSFATSSSGPTPYQKLQMSVKDKVESAIANNKVALFSKSYCPHCRKAKDTIKNTLQVPDSDVIIYELDGMEDGDAIQSYLLEKTKQRTVPNIFIAQTHIGGNDALQSKLDQARELLAQ